MKKNPDKKKKKIHLILLWNTKIEHQNLKSLRVQCWHKIVIRHLNISFVTNKFKMLLFIIVGATDISLISEIRIYFPFPTSKFVKNDNSNIFKLALNEGQRYYISF